MDTGKKEERQEMRGMLSYGKRESVRKKNQMMTLSFSSGPSWQRFLEKKVVKPHDGLVILS